MWQKKFLMKQFIQSGNNLVKLPLAFRQLTAAGPVEEELLCTQLSQTMQIKCRASWQSAHRRVDEGAGSINSGVLLVDCKQAHTALRLRKCVCSQAEKSHGINFQICSPRVMN